MREPGKKPAEQARAGIRAGLGATGRSSGVRLRTAGPYAILAFVTASALAPIAARSGTQPAFGAALNRIGGGDPLAGLWTAAARTITGDDLPGGTAPGAGAGPTSEAGPDPAPGADREEAHREAAHRKAADGQAHRDREGADGQEAHREAAHREATDDEAASDAAEEAWRAALAAELRSRLAADRSRALHAEISRMLRGIGAIRAAIGAAADADDELRQVLQAAFTELGEGVAELGWMLDEVRESVDGLGHRFAARAVRLRRELDEARGHLTAVTRERLPGGDGVPAGVPAGAVPPYPGLAGFQPEDAPWFRGREPDVAELLGRLAEQAAGGPPLVLTGVSGAGKSSLVRAGLLPGIAAGALGEQAAAWPWVLTTPGVRPLDRLRTRLRSLAGIDQSSLAALAARAAADGNRPVIVVDRFEELFTDCPDPAERLAYVTALTDAAPALVVIVMRSDFYPACAGLPPLARVLATGHVTLGPLDAGAIHRAVVEPAERAGLGVEAGLPALLAADLGAAGPDPGDLPLLAHALRATWDRREGARLTVAAYRETGGLRHAIAATAESIYLSLPPEDRDRLREALLGLVAVTPGGTVLRRRGERAGADSRVLRRLVRARLVTVGAETVEIGHEALVRGWPRLAGWLAGEPADPPADRARWWERRRPRP